ncbi:MAG TPA: phosphate ABC transporter permease subunit PstC [Humisphaera sp.]|jgi:phosphate transport system permease protein|nr:phosphate ABC transporter permease subunit PstC [Humisphaera sp.]
MTVVSPPSPGAGKPLDYPSSSDLFIRGRRGKHPISLLELGARGSGIVIILMMTGLVAVLGYAAAPSLHTFGLKFLAQSSWRPNELEQFKRDANGKIVKDEDGEPIKITIPPAFGALPVIYGTAVSSALAMTLAIPLSFGAALFLVRIAPRRLVMPVSFLIEFLAAIPSIAYGLWGLFVLVPFLQRFVEPPLNDFFGRVPGLGWLHSEATTGRDMFSGGLVLAIMIIPIITAVSRDVLRAVPRIQIEGTLALGATWWQSSWEMLRYSRSGLFGAAILGLARASGETMAIAMVIGNINQIRSSPFAAAQTMSSLLANEFSEASSDLHRAALLEVALILLVMSLLFNIAARYLVVGRGGARAAAGH